MNKKGLKNKRVLAFIRNSYIYKLIKRIFSMLTTLLLIMLLSIGGLMFYFNMQGQAASQRGEQYIPPFGLYTIISGSMVPNINVYDVVTAIQVDDLSKIKVGDVITFISTWDLNYGVTVTHRVVNIIKGENGDFKFVTKGDANEAIDGAYVTRENLIGRVMFKLPQLGRIQFFLATKVGWFVAIFVPALAVIVWDVIKIFKLKVLKNNIGVIKNTDEANKTYFDGDNLDNRDMVDTDLQKTAIISKEVVDIDIEKKDIAIKEVVKNVKPKKEPEVVRGPLPTRKKVLLQRRNEKGKELNNKILKR